MSTTPATRSLFALADSLAETFPGRDDAPLARALLRLLAQGEPVAGATLATEAGRDPRDVESTITRWPNVHRDELDRVIAFSGLSLVPTSHRFRAGGRQLYTWCAWDTLFLPALLDGDAVAESRCPVTGAAVRLTVSPEGARASEPADLLVSFPPLAQTSTAHIIESFCCHVHFLAGKAAAARWLSDNEGGLALSLADAHGVGRVATRALAGVD